MKLFDDVDRVGCYLDHIAHRVEKTKGGDEVKMIDLTLRVQPFTPDLAAALDPDVRALLFRLDDAEPKPKIKALDFALTVPRQILRVYPVPEIDNGGMAFDDVEISDPRARTEKNVDGFALVLYASLGPLTPDQLEFVCEWLTEQRFVAFDPQTPAFDFDADPLDEVEAHA